METMIPFRGRSGVTYYYVITNPPWKKVPANYMFAKWSGTFWFVPYIGQTGDASDRFPDHERWLEAARRGANVILTHVSSPILAVREKEEQDLIQAIRPMMNVQHQPSSSSLGLRPTSSSLGLGPSSSSGRTLLTMSQSASPSLGLGPSPSDAQTLLASLVRTGPR